MNLHPHLNAAIENFGARLELCADTARPWTVAFLATLSCRDGTVLRGRGRTPQEALTDLESSAFQAASNVLHA